jgi:hypothetical protein
MMTTAMKIRVSGVDISHMMFTLLRVTIQHPPRAASISIRTDLPRPVQQPSHWVVTPSCYRLRVCTSVVTTTAASTRTTTMASASKDALISVRPAIFPIASEVTTVGFRLRAYPMTVTATHRGRCRARCSTYAQAATACHPSSLSGSLGAQDPPGGPRDRTTSAYLEFPFFGFCFNYAAQMLD